MSPIIKKGVFSLIANLNSDVSSFIRVDLPAPLGPQSTKAGGGSLESPEAEPILFWLTQPPSLGPTFRESLPDVRGSWTV